MALESHPLSTNAVTLGASVNKGRFSDATFSSSGFAADCVTGVVVH